MQNKMSSALSRRSFLTGATCAGLMAALSLSKAWAADIYQQTALSMGTIVRIDVAHAPIARAQEAVASAFARASALESLLTRFDSASPLSVLNTQGSLADVPQELAAVLRKSGDFHRLTSSSFDPSILPVLEAMQRGEAEGSPLSRQEMAELLRVVDYGRVRLDKGVRLDEGMSISLDGIAKGYIAQAMSVELTRCGCPNHLVNAGGDVIASGSPERGGAWRVGVRSPFDAAGMEAVVLLSGRALATSGVYEQPIRGGSGSHLVIPTSMMTSDVVSASVLAADGATADALATAFSVMAPGTVLKTCRGLRDVEAMLVLRNGSVVRSEGFALS